MQAENPPNRLWHPLTLASLVFVLALALRLTYFVQTFDSPLFQTFQTDAQWHAEWARNIVTGQFTHDRPFFRAPLYPYFVAAAYAATGDSFTGVKAVQHVLGALTCSLIGIIGCRVFSPRVGLLAGIIAACYGPLIYFENELLIASLAVLLFTLTLLVLDVALRRASWPWWSAVGFLLGLGAIARPNFLALVPVLTVWWLWQCRRRNSLRRGVVSVVALLLGTALPILPVTLHNVFAGGEPVLIGTQGGINFYIGNNPLADGKTALAFAPTQWETHAEYVDNVWWTSRVNAEQLVGRSLSEAEVSRFWFTQGLKFWSEQPLDAFALLARKSYYFLNGFEITSNRSMYVDSLWSPLAGLLTWSTEPGFAFPLGLIMPLAVLGLFFIGPDNRPARIWRWLLLAYVLSVIAFFVTGRFRMPIVPLLILFAAHAVAVLFTVIRNREWRVVRPALAGLVALLLFCNSTFLGVRELELDRELAIIGTAYQRLGEPGRALPYMQQAVESDPDNFAAHLDLAGVLFELGRYAEAARAYRRAVELHPAVHHAHLGLASALAAQGELRAAADALRAALVHIPDEPRLHAALADVLTELGEAAAAQHHGERARALEAAAPGTSAPAAP